MPSSLILHPSSLPKTFYEKFERFADAPGAVTKMRELVLNLAVKGALVSQDESEGSGDELLIQIKEQRNQLPKTEGIKPRKLSSESIQPYEIPNNWTWTSLANAGHDLGQEKPTSPISYIDVASIDNKRGELSERVETLQPDKAPSRARKKVRPGTVIYSTVRPYLLNIAIVDREYTPTPIASTAFGILFPFKGVARKFLFYWLRSGSFTSYVESQMKGMAYPAINDAKFYSGPFPLPPLAEQKRIVAKVDALMALCDQLEAQQAEREAQAAAVQRAARHRFHQAPGPDTVDYLFHSAFNIQPSSSKSSSLNPQPSSFKNHPSSLRQSILTLAVQGKLVPQDPGDEPADDGQRQALKLEVTPFDIPDNWKWSLLEHLSDINGGFAFKSSDYKDKGTRVIRISDFDETGFKEHRIVRHPFEPEFEKFSLEEENILMAMTGGTVGKSYYVSKLPEPMVVNQRVATIKVNPLAVPRYIDILIRSELTQRVIQEAKNSTNDNISMKSIKGFLVPLPPLTEQRRIVSKVDQLMALVDQLEAQLEQTQSAAQKLLEALIAELAAA